MSNQGYKPSPIAVQTPEPSQESLLKVVKQLKAAVEQLQQQVKVLEDKSRG